MKTRRVLFALLSLAVVAGWASQAPAEITLGPGETEPPPDAALFSFDQADAIAVDSDSGVMRIVRTRPARAQYLAAIRFKLTSSDDGSTRYTLMRNRQTHHPLLYMSHRKLDRTAKGISETSLSLFGLMDVMYQVNFESTPGAAIAPAPVVKAKDIRLVNGRLFSTDSAFAYVEIETTGEGTRTACKPGRVVRAESLHPSLRGSAFGFECIAVIMNDPEPVRWNIFYLDHYAQYIPDRNFGDEGKMFVTFEITDVAFADWK